MQKYLNRCGVNYGKSLSAVCRWQDIEKGSPVGFAGLSLWRIAAAVCRLYGWCDQRVLCARGGSEPCNWDRHTQVRGFHLPSDRGDGGSLSGGEQADGVEGGIFSLSWQLGLYGTRMGISFGCGFESKGGADRAV